MPGHLAAGLSEDISNVPPASEVAGKHPEALESGQDQGTCIN